VSVLAVPAKNTNVLFSLSLDEGTAASDALSEHSAARLAVNLPTRIKLQAYVHGASGAAGARERHSGHIADRKLRWASKALKSSRLETRAIPPIRISFHVHS
jgi:hypothetical protein